MRRFGGEDGVGLVELVVALGLMAVVAGIAYSGLGSFARASKATNDRAVVTAEARTALERLLRDLRAANPIDALPAAAPVSTYDNAVSFSVHCATPGVDGCSAQRLRPVRYAVVGSRLERTEGGVTSVLLGPTGSTAVPVDQRSGAVSGGGGPVFTYYNADGDVLSTAPGSGVTSSHVRDCARSVEVRLHVIAADGDPASAIDLRTRVDLRNYYEVTPCSD